MNLKLFFLLALLTQFLLGCDNLVVTKRSSVSVDTNAFYTAFQKKPTDDWRQINFDNGQYRLETLTFTVDEGDNPYSVVFVCPAKEEGIANDVYIFYATAAEMQLLDFRCRKAAVEFSTVPVYGKISGVKSASFIGSSQGELAWLALSKTVTITALGAYAADVRSGNRDVVGYKGKHITLGNKVGTPETFLINRRYMGELTTDSVRADIAFEPDAPGFNALFDPNALSTVNISGIQEGEVFSSEVRFVSVNKTLLTLAESTSNSFSFTPVPLLPSTGLHDGIYNKNEFYPNEGHELSVVVKDENGDISREAIKFFTLSNAQEHNLVMPQGMKSTPTLSLGPNSKFQNINLSWDKHEDPDSGTTQLYRWVFEGKAADKSPNSTSKLDTENLRWFVYATPGWLATVSRTPNVYNLTLPTNYAASIVVDGKKVDIWRDDWAFKVNTPVDWELTVFTASEKGNAGLVIDYLLNRNIAENYSFTSATVRSTISPSL